MICDVPDCNQPAYARKMCKRHYHQWYSREHSSKAVERTRLWRLANPERYKAVQSAYHSTDEFKATNRARGAKERAEKPGQYKARMKRWKDAHPQRKNELNRLSAKRHPETVRANLARRRGALLKATPPWLSKEHLRQMKAIYAEAVRLSAETGVVHEVDHIIPLRAHCAAGLHVPWNLRVIPLSENRRRNRRWTSEQLTALQAAT